jgi:ESCRT-I complex subunit VPS37
MLNWLSKGPKSQLPEPTALQVLRAKQIEQLRLLDCAVAEIQRDVEYRLTFSDVLSLYISLPPLFPQERPVLRVSPPVNHPWLNEQMIVTGCGAVNSFKAHSDLGKVVKEVIEEFRQNPPALVASSSVYSAASSALPAVVTKHPVRPQTVQPAYSSQPLRNEDKHMLPAIADSFPALEGFSVTELRGLENNEEIILKLLQPNMEALVNDRAEIVQTIEACAMENIAKQALLEDKKRLILEKVETMNNLRHRLDELLRQQDEQLKKYEPGLIQANLKVASLQADEKAEGFADEFLDGRMSVDEFRKSYMAVRIQYHQRRAMEDKLSQLVSRQPSMY